MNFYTKILPFCSLLICSIDNTEGIYNQNNVDDYNQVNSSVEDNSDNLWTNLEQANIRIFADRDIFYLYNSEVNTYEILNNLYSNSYHKILPAQSLVYYLKRMRELTNSIRNVNINYITRKRYLNMLFRSILQDIVGNVDMKYGYTNKQKNRILQDIVENVDMKYGYTNKQQKHLDLLYFYDDYGTLLRDNKSEFINVTQMYKEFKDILMDRRNDNVRLRYIRCQDEHKKLMRKLKYAIRLAILQSKNLEKRAAKLNKGLGNCNIF